MPGQVRYVDVTGSGDAWSPFPAHAPWIARLAAKGFSPLCAFERTYASGKRFEWSAMVDASRATALSIALADGRATVYAVSVLADGTTLETEWWPGWKHWWLLGPGAVLDDLPARTRKKTARSGDLDALLAAHARLLARHAAAIPWTAEGYLDFRHRSGTRMQVSACATSAVVEGILTAGWLALVVFLVRAGEVWPAKLLALAAFYLAIKLFVAKLVRWVARVIVRWWVPLRLRERLAGFMVDPDEPT